MIHYNASSDKSRVSYDDSVAYATARGGRLATLTEVQYYLESNCTLYCTKPDCADGSFGVHQWVAVTTPRIPRIPCMGYSEPINYGNPEEVNDGKDWVQVGVGFGNDMGLSHSHHLRVYSRLEFKLWREALYPKITNTTPTPSWLLIAGADVGLDDNTVDPPPSTAEEGDARSKDNYGGGRIPGEDAGPEAGSSSLTTQQRTNQLELAADFDVDGDGDIGFYLWEDAGPEAGSSSLTI